jgi:uncharacterized damage-inducible protein DinB
MVHQCQSENTWFQSMFGIAVTGEMPIAEPTRIAFLRHYASVAEQRLTALHGKDDEWWETEVAFFETRRSRTWIMVRRIAHTAHHRGQQMALLRMLNRELHSNYGPTADTGGLMANQAPVIYAYADLQAILNDGTKAVLPGSGGKPVTERPEK